ncbi:MAG TPA: GYD domain-containing protein [Nitrososphaeraceae archaeon]|nr:GYD domain-containing protein [Nitrososphaeraceae archaeon]
MAHYIIFFSFSQHGIENVKEIPHRVESFKQLCDNKGVKIHGHYFTFGKYDVVFILEAPDDSTIMATLMSLESKGNVRSETLKAFTYEETKNIIDNL